MGFGLFAAIHYWFPKMTGRMYDKRMSIVAWLITFVGFNLFYFPMFVLGWRGMPRRFFDYLPQYTELHQMINVGSFIMAAGLLLMAITLLQGLFAGKKAPANPWGGATLEWTLPSPPSTEDFEEIPVITTGPYEFGNKKAPA
jgi:cytochrome c oxidase subunit 1